MNPNGDCVGPDGDCESPDGDCEGPDGDCVGPNGYCVDRNATLRDSVKQKSPLSRESNPEYPGCAASLTDFW